jgi:YVTN family beta-propeller protein
MAAATLSLFFVASALSDNVRGAWSPVAAWPMVPIHAVLMPDGRVLTFGTLGYQIYDVWDPSAGLGAGHLTLPNTVASNLFCSAALVLPGGSGVLIAGGGPESNPNQDSRIFDYGNNTLSRDDDLNRPRYYASTITLTDGRTYIQGGTGGADRPEVRENDGIYRLLTGADTRQLNDYYPRNFVSPDGRVFGFDADGNMYFVETGGTGSLVLKGKLTGSIGYASTAAMYRPGKIIQFGARSSGAQLIDITSGNPVVTTTQSLSSQRNWATATVLADGRVLATGGSEVRNDLQGVNTSAEIWNPSTGQWVRGAAGALPRLYHSMALLLPDGSVLVGGGGNPGPLSNDNAEIYYPPYLFDTSGGWAVRPVVSASPGSIQINESFTVDLASQEVISRVVLVKTGAVTHSFNMDQRFLELAFQRSGTRLTVQAPTRAADAPPGYYLLFVFNSAGTPSVGKIVRAVVESGPAPSQSPVLDNPGNQSGQIGTPLQLQLVATDPDGDPLTFGATGLPQGLAIDSATGLISGTPISIGTFNVTVTVTDGSVGDSRAFVWTVTQTAGTFILNAPATPAPSLAGSEVTLEASVVGGSDVQFKWDFDDGSPETEFSSSTQVRHTFAAPGIYYVTVTAIDAGGLPQVSTVVVTVHLPLTERIPSVSTNILVEERSNSADRLWVVNQDNDSVTVFNAESHAKIAEIPVGSGPRTLTVARPGEIWVTNKFGASISVINSGQLSVSTVIPLPYGSQPFGIATSPTGGHTFVVLEATGRLLKLNSSTRTVVASVDVGRNPRHVSVDSDGNFAYVSRYISPPLPGESTVDVQTESGGQPQGGEVLVVNASAMSVQQVITLRHSDRPDFETQGRGVPNYLGAVAISPDGQSARVPSKQDNIRRGVLRDGQGLNFQNTVRAISSLIDMGDQAELLQSRIDHDNAGVASAIAYDRLGVYAFVALETSREVAVIDAHGSWEMFRIDVGRAPQGLAISSDGSMLYVSNFMDRTVDFYDISRLVDQGIADVPRVATRVAVGSERLPPAVLTGKRLFYDAQDTRLARDGYISCASCHNDGGHDGRVWDLSGFGEGLRNTVRLRGRAGGHGFLHWSNNFDEVQDFEGQIRGLAGGTGLMTNVQLNAGTRNQPLGDPKSGISADLDALAAYVQSLAAFDRSPFRDPDGSLSAAAMTGRAVFEAKNCAACHGGSRFTHSARDNARDIGTVTAASGGRLGGPLLGIDIPTLRDVWATAPYLHVGSAPTIEAAIRSHAGLEVSDAELADLTAYVLQIGSEEETAPGDTLPPPPPPDPSPTPGSGTGLSGAYFNNMALSGAPALQRIEAINFGWAGSSPGPGINADQFSVRWTGRIEASGTGAYRFQTASNDGVRVWINGALLIDNWTNHSTTNNNSPAITLVKNQRYSITMEFYDNTGPAVARLRWQRPAQTKYAAVPATRLYPN